MMAVRYIEGIEGDASRLGVGITYYTDLIATGNQGMCRQGGEKEI